LLKLQSLADSTDQHAARLLLLADGAADQGQTELAT
jgi:hypothetical protein